MPMHNAMHIVHLDCTRGTARASCLHRDPREAGPGRHTDPVAASLTTDAVPDGPRTSSSQDCVPGASGRHTRESLLFYIPSHRLFSEFAVLN